MTVVRCLASALCLLVLMGSLPSAAFGWSLADHIDSVLMYDGVTFGEFTYSDNLIKGHRAHLMRTATREPDGQLKPYAEGMQVNGELREGQVLLTPDTSINGSWAEFAVHGCTYLKLQYGLCDIFHEKGGEGTKLGVTVLRGEEVVAEAQVSLTETKWSEQTVQLQGGDLFVRIFVEFVGHRGSNWSALVLEGDGEIGTREEARALCPNGAKVGKMTFTPEPATKRVTARDGYDVLFYGDTPFINLAAKGHRSGSQEWQVKAGVNLYYVEGATFTRLWSEDAEDQGVVIPEDSRIYRDLWLCQKHGLPYKTACSMAHCVPFLPEWLVAKYDLGMQDHHIRQPKPYHASFIKPMTLEMHKKGLEGWLAPFKDQAAILVLGQEDEIALWDDQSEIAQHKWREWLEGHFEGDWGAFDRYVGGVQGADSFAQAPYPKHFTNHEAYGFPRRATWLKLMWAVEANAEYLAALRDHCNEVAPGLPVTQRYVACPHGRAISKLVDFDYNYCYGHLSVEGVACNYGSGKKIWTGIYGHCGVLPLPRGGSVGLTIDRDIRRAQMGEKEWELNIFTQLANGCSGFEASPFFNTWGPRWEGGALVESDGSLTENGRAAKAVMDKVQAIAPYMAHYDRHEDIAVYHDAAFQSRLNIGIGMSLSQSKVGIYTLIRELGYHAEPLTTWEMTAENLAGRKVLVLAGSVPIAPEVQEAIREYVRGGGTLLAIFSAQGEGFPGCNSYEFQGGVQECVAECSFENPPAQAHLGDVLGIVEGGGSARHSRVQWPVAAMDLEEFNALVDEGKWADQEACCSLLVPAEGARAVATFEDGTAAAVFNEYEGGQAVTLGLDCGLIANSLTSDAMYEGLDALLEGFGCRKVYDTGDYYVEAGMWHNDAGQRLLILANHDAEKAHTVKLPDGEQVTIQPWRPYTWTSDAR